ncbi:hypothetical protein NPX13_g1208 [Xylaria arbuscula]|uniref:Uncharacterized protein n=1 Tax=Xylaria arbuscula TaxID=114810 RepID=A0A9W8NMG3_9PEZI|nr:hypothetical protein NPX13_g1208 [Xylaria arbuscula]
MSARVCAATDLDLTSTAASIAAPSFSTAERPDRTDDTNVSNGFDPIDGEPKEQPTNFMWAVDRAEIT